jgi:beta-galactosidase
VCSLIILTARKISMGLQEGLKIRRREFLGAVAGGITILTPRKVWGALPAAANPASAHTFGQEGEHFLLDGQPFQIICGEMHYARVPREYWRDRLRKIRAMGLNTLCTYMFWNMHEPEAGQFNFSGNLDVAEFIRLAQQEGLWVLLRPGPYSCAEWEFGGFPYWLLATAGLTVRSRDPQFLALARKYMIEVGKQLAPLQITQGGPILMVQVENEYGSYGADHEYMRDIERMIRDAGFHVTLYTSDGEEDRMLAGGTLPDALAAINFGDGDDPAKQFAAFAKARTGVPRMCGEFWDGWFDHWGEKHHTTKPEASAQGLDWMLSEGISASLYMVHGGTTFGFMNGANFDSAYQPGISSYDYNAPIDEAGRPTEKFHALSAVIRKHLPAGTQVPALPEPLPMIEVPRWELRESAALDSLRRDPVRSERPKTFEALGQAYGFVLYRHRVEKPARGHLEIHEVRDYALISQGANRLGVLDRRRKQSGLNVELAAGASLDILVENMGRVNYGKHLLDTHKGITGRVTLNGQELTGWENYRLPLTELSALEFSPQAKAGPAFHRGTFDLESVGDTFLDLRGWGKGHAWMNGHHLGRYWRIGPQQSLFVPAPWLKQGRNEVIVLDVEEGRERTLAGRKEAVWEND